MTTQSQNPHPFSRPSASPPGAKKHKSVIVCQAKDGHLRQPHGGHEVPYQTSENSLSMDIQVPQDNNPRFSTPEVASTSSIREADGWAVHQQHPQSVFWAQHPQALEASPQMERSRDEQDRSSCILKASYSSELA
ncbi:Hypothetical predicted protein [Podarcis lilfordi]|uniref:Uncharacterized protein n=1 Tax=Podarcis lilfordi TaxID=74358 RepID=A0AA35JUU1_9SAUR|nr:Hypothetical predicted protein [Podarcis lilfordi]